MTGCYKEPTGIYFDGQDHTILVWVKVRIHNSWSRIIDFSQSNRSNGVDLGLSYYTTGRPVFETLDSSGSWEYLTSSFALPINQWTNIAEVYKSLGAVSTIYINGIQTASGAVKPIMNVTRTSNYVGRSQFYPDDLDANADLDEIKIFNRALSPSEIQNEMNNDMFI